MNYVDTTGWNLKSRNVKLALVEAIKNAVDFGMDELNKATKKNLSGPHYKVGTRGPMTGRMPIPVITGFLKKSLQSRRLDKFTGIVYSDKRIANYNEIVHDGKKGKKGKPGRRPRRFLGDAVKERKQAVANRWKYEVIKAVRKVGQ